VERDKPRTPWADVVDVPGDYREVAELNDDPPDEGRRFPRYRVITTRLLK